VAAQDQEERERQDGRQRGEEGGGAYGYLPGGREEVPYHLAQLLPQIGQLGIEPLQEPTEAVLLGEVLDVLRRPFGRLGRGVDELGKTVYLVDQQGQEDPHHEQQHNHQRQVGDSYGDGPLDQAVAPLQPVDGRVEHRRQKEGDDEPADEGLYLPQEEERAQHHHHGEQGGGDGAHNLRGRGARPPASLLGPDAFG
jgi:hypothetical protein